jgi:hypothetical protein
VLGEGIVTPCCKKPASYETLHRASELEGFSGTSWAMENRYGMEC